MELKLLIERMTVAQDSQLARKADEIHKITGATLEQSKTWFVKQLFFLSDFPCVQYFPASETARDGRSTYCFSDMKGTKLILNSDKHLLD